MKKKVTVISACLVLFVAWLFGVIYTNVRAERPVVKIYYMNENVPYEDDYFRRADNILNGYSATVLGYEIIPYDEYAEKYNIDLPEIETDEAGNTIYRPEYVYDVEIKFANTENEDGTIDMFDTLLVNGKELMLRADEYLWDEMYPQRDRIRSACARIPKRSFIFRLLLNRCTVNDIRLKKSKSRICLL